MKWFENKKIDREKLEYFMEYLMVSASNWKNMDKEEKALHIHWAANHLEEILK